MKAVCQKTSCVYFTKGSQAAIFTPGDFILVSQNTFFAKLVQFGQALRNKNPRFTKWNHCAMIVNPHGELIDANGKKVVLVPLETYTNKEYYLINIDASIEDRHEAVDFALACLGQTYGWITILSIAFSLLSGLKFSFGFSGQEICSGLVTRALERTSFIPPEDASHMTPSDLAECYLPS